MDSFVSLLKRQEDFVCINGAHPDEIEKAENKLALSFSQEYKDYLCLFGVASAGGHEFTGIIDSKRLNVVCATREAKRKNENVPESFYLIEDSGIDCTLIWQEESGKVYQTIGNGDPCFIYNNLAEFFDKSVLQTSNSEDIC